MKHNFFKTFLLSFLLLLVLPCLRLNVNAAIGTVYGGTLKMGGTGGDSGKSIVKDSNGNIYIAGYFMGTGVEFNTTGSGASDIKNSNGATDIFITKYNSDGTYGWTRTFGGTDNEKVNQIVINNTGEIFLVGFFGSIGMEFNTTGSGASDIRNSSGYADIFITKYNSDNSYGWTRTIGGTGSDIAYGIALDSTGNIYLSGSFSSTGVNFNTTGSGASDIKNSGGNEDLFVTKYNSDNSYGWTRTVGAGFDENGQKVAVDLSGNVYIVGYFGGSGIQFNTTGSGASDLKTSNGSDDIFIMKYNSNGTYGWTRILGKGNSDYGNDVAVDTLGNIYFTGHISGSNIQFNTTGSGASDIKSTSGSSPDIFITKYNSNGSYGWSRLIGGTATDLGRSVATDSSNNVYICGAYSSVNTNFNTTGSGANDIRSTGGSYDFFLTKYNSNGTYGFTRTIGGTSDDWCEDLIIDNSYTIHTTGYFLGTNVNFNTTGGGVSDIKSSNGQTDIFYLKYTQGYTVDNVPTNFSLFLSSDQTTNVSITAQTGTNSVTLKKGTIPISDFSLSFNNSPNFSTIITDVDLASGKAFVNGLNITNIPQLSATHSLYIPKLTGQTIAYICPDTQPHSNITDIYVGCPNGYGLVYGYASNLSIVNISGRDYWRVTGLTGTGGMGTYQYGTTLSITPNSGTNSVSQEVHVSYTSASSFVSGNKVELTWDNGITLSDCSVGTRTVNADGIGGNDGVSSINGSVYTYTFNANSTPTVSFCMNLQGTGGNYAVKLDDDNGTYGSTLYYIQPHGNEVTIKAKIDTTLSFNIVDFNDTGDENQCNFGTIDTTRLVPNSNGTVDSNSGECGYGLAIGTNSAEGFRIQISATSPLSSGSSTIRNVTDNGGWSPGVEAYGITDIIPATTGKNNSTGQYTETLIESNSYGIDSSVVPTTEEDFISFGSGVKYTLGGTNEDITKVIHGLVIGAGTPAGSYSQVVTYTVTAAF